MTETKKTNGYAAEECTPEIKRRKMFPTEHTLGVCDNCHQQMVISDGTCLQCGHGPRIGAT